MIGDDDFDGAVQPTRTREPAPPISTRAPAPRPRRLSRRAIALFAGGSAIGLAAALGFALSSGGDRVVPQETVAVDHRQPTDLLATAPKDYGAIVPAKVAALGPPPSPVAQPGTLGAGASATLTAGAASSAAPNNEDAASRQRQRQQRDSAIASKLFATSGETARSGQVADAPATPTTSTTGAQSTTNSPTGSDAQDRKAAFLTGGARGPTINSGQLTAPAGRNVVTAGSTIAAALITGLSSDLPGEVVAQVTEDVFDSATGRIRLIPQGTQLIGSYDAHVSYGQSRALVVWTRLILPDGRSLDLDRLIGTDAAGQSGFVDRVNHHTGQLLQAGLLSTLFGVGSNVATGGGNNNDIAFAIRDSAGQSVKRAGDKLVEHQLDVQPTITIRPGARARAGQPRSDAGAVDGRIGAKASAIASSLCSRIRLSSRWRSGLRSSLGQTASMPIVALSSAIGRNATPLWGTMLDAKTIVAPFRVRPCRARSCRRRRAVRDEPVDRCDRAACDKRRVRYASP